MSSGLSRRALIKGIAAVQLLGLLPWQVLGEVKRAGADLWRRVRPNEPSWPNASEWQALADEVGGNLIRVEPLLAANDAKENLRNPFYLGDQPAGTQVSGWFGAWSPAPSVYAVKARQASHVAAAVNFARRHRLRLVVKGAGHSYQGTSCAPDSLLVWTRAMNVVTLHEAFVPQGCAGLVDPVPAVSAGAGAVWIDLYHAVTTEGGRYVQGGGCADVGVAGLVQSGGFGSMSKGFGTAAANLLEAEVVTADGAVRVVNAHSDPDLFWALQGGGGGSWGVVTRVTLRTHALPAQFGAAWGRVRAANDAAFRRLLARFCAFYAERLLNPHWGEQFSVCDDNSLKLSMVCQGLTAEEVRATWQPFLDWVAAAGADYTWVDQPNSNAWDSRGWWRMTPGRKSMIKDPRPGAPAHHGWWKGDQDQVGAFLYGYESLWLPATLLAPGEQSRLAEALFAASRHKTVDVHCNKGLAGAPEAAIAATRRTATNPAACDAFALVIIADGEGPAYPGLERPPVDEAKARRVAQSIDAATAELRAVAPGGGSYVSESNYFNAHWAEAFWGENYTRLKAVKAKYDPEGLFYVHHGVGSEEWSADGFERSAVGSKL